jgi:hypothetical protein
MLSVLSRAIEDEEARHLQSGGGEIAPGIFEIFLTPEALDKADRASRIVQAESLTSFCREVIDEAATDILARETSWLTVTPAAGGQSETEPAGKPIPLPGAPLAKDGDLSPKSNSGGHA